MLRYLIHNNSAEELVLQEMRGGAMETYKLVVIVVKPFVDENMWRNGLSQRLTTLEERTQEVSSKLNFSVKQWPTPPVDCRYKCRY